jgi:hypothetical protein
MMDKRRTLLLLLSLIVTFVVIRISLHASPNTDFNVASYNIHHLFTGLLLIAFCGIPAVLLRTKGLIIDGLVIGFGVGLSLALDEFVYLITTDGSNASYLLPISFWGGVIMIGIACVYVAVLYLFNSRK